jgi:hypothetical protein
LLKSIGHTFQALEKGERNVSIVIAEKLAIALNVPITELFKELK